MSDGSTSLDTHHEQVAALRCLECVVFLGLGEFFFP